MIIFLAFGLVSVIISFMTTSESSYGIIPCVIGLVLLATANFFNDKFGNIEEVNLLLFLNFLCDLFNFLIGLGVFFYGLEMLNHPEVMLYSGLAYAIINMSPLIFLVIYNAEVSRFQFRATMFILQIVCFTLIVSQGDINHVSLKFKS